MKVRRSTLKDRVTVKTRTGEGSYGDVLAAPQELACSIDETRRMVRDASGQQVVSEVTLTLHPRTRVTGSTSTVNPMDVFTAESEVDAGGRVSRVISARENRMRGYVVSVEVTCT